MTDKEILKEFKDIIDDLYIINPDLTLFMKEPINKEAAIEEIDTVINRLKDQIAEAEELKKELGG